MADTSETVLERLKNDLPSRYDVSTGSYTYDIEKVHAEEFHNAYDLVENKERQFSVATATGIYLDRLVADFGVMRKDAVNAEGYVTIRGDTGAAVHVGDKVAAGNVIFSIQTYATINDAGGVTVPVVCDMPGAAGNVAAGAINRFPVTLPNILSVTNAEPTSGGADEETDSALRERFSEYVSRPITSGNKWQYIAWAKEISGVGDAKCQPLWNGNGTVKVIVVDTDMQPASETLLSRVREHIEQQHPIGAEVTVAAATVLQINVACHVISDSDATESIKNNINNYLKSVSFKAGYVSYAKIGEAILHSDGVIDYEDLRVNGGNENIPVSETESAVLGGVEIDRD